MTVKIRGEYIPNKKIKMIHEDSGVEIITAAPKDNNGDGSSFSPTDLFASSLGACQLTIMAIYAERTQIDLTGSWFTLEKHMSAAPRMVSNIVIEMHLPKNLTDEQKVKIEQISKTCPVHHSLNQLVSVQQAFIYDV